MTKQRTIAGYATFFFLLAFGLLVGYGNYRYFYPDVQQFGIAEEDAPAIATAKVYAQDGKAVTAADFKGKTVIFTLWATWCPPCLKEMPQLRQLEKKYGDKLEIMAVAVEPEGFSKFKNFLDSREIEYPTLYWDKGLSVFKGLRLRGLPTAFILSPEGKVVKKLEGEVNWLVPGMRDVLGIKD